MRSARAKDCRWARSNRNDHPTRPARLLRLANDAVAVFHRKYAAAAWSDMYHTSSDRLRTTAMHVTDNGDDAIVVMEYATRFASGAATERFVWHISDGNACLHGCTITRLDSEKKEGIE